MGTARAQPGHRMEHDLLGELAVPGDAYYGVHTTRALRNFAAGAALLADRCLTGLTANEEALRDRVASSAGLATALSPYLGYAAASELARDAQASNRPVRVLARERGLLPPEVIDTLLADPADSPAPRARRTPPPPGSPPDHPPRSPEE